MHWTHVFTDFSLHHLHFEVSLSSTHRYKKNHHKCEKLISDLASLDCSDHGTQRLVITEITFIRADCMRVCLLTRITVHHLEDSQMDKTGGFMEILCPIGKNLTWWKEEPWVVLLASPFCFRRVLEQGHWGCQKLMRSHFFASVYYTTVYHLGMLIALEDPCTWFQGKAGEVLL